MASAAPEIPALARDRAFESLYRRYVTDVYRYALALLRNPADAEDVTQTTFMNAYRAFQRGEEPIKPQNWLIKIAHNAARTKYARATRRVREVPLEDHVESLALPEEDRPDVHAVLAALGELPLNQRAALVMRELEGRSYGEIADTLGVSVPAVETLIFRARRSLKMKASAVRILSAVPLPPSLGTLFDGSGAVVAGGGAIGSGFLIKAAVAVIAGAVATGVAGGDGTHAARAAAAPAEKVSAPPWTQGVGVFARPVAAKRHVVRASARHVKRVHAAARRSHARQRSYVHEDAKSEAPQATAPALATQSSEAASSSAPPAAASTPTPTHTDAVQEVTHVVEEVTAAVPVSTPQLPAVPVELPPTPPVTVPSLPALPSLPAPPKLP